MSATHRRAVIITALPIERSAVLEHFRDISEEPPLKGSIYRRGIFDERSDPWEVIVAEIGAGNEGAAAEAERVISHYSPEVALFVGVAGAIKDLKHGDVVASTKVYGYESGKDDKGGFMTRPAVELTAYALEQRARYEAGEPDWRQRIRRIGEVPHAVAPDARVAPIAAGEKVVASNRSRTYTFIRRHYGDVVAVEMEGHGFLLGVRMNHPTQGIVVRGISDLVGDKDEANDKTWQPIAARHAAAFAFQLLAKWPRTAASDLETSPAEIGIDLSRWFDESADTFEAERAEQVKLRAEDRFAAGIFMCAYQLRAARSLNVDLRTLSKHLENAQVSADVGLYPWFNRRNGTQFIKKGDCIQNLTSQTRVPAATFTRASPQCRFFTVGTLFEDFVTRYRGRFVLDPLEVLAVHVRCLEHARQTADLVGAYGADFMFGYRGLSGRELAFWWEHMRMVSAPYGRAADDSVVASCSLEFDRVPVSPSKIMDALHGPLGAVFINFDLKAMGHDGFPTLEWFGQRIGGVLDGERV